MATEQQALLVLAEKTQPLDNFLHQILIRIITALDSEECFATFSAHGTVMAKGVIFPDSITAGVPFWFCFPSHFPVI